MGCSRPLPRHCRGACRFANGDATRVPTCSLAGVQLWQAGFCCWTSNCEKSLEKPGETRWDLESVQLSDRIETRGLLVSFCRHGVKPVLVQGLKPFFQGWCDCGTTKERGLIQGKTLCKIGSRLSFAFSVLCVPCVLRGETSFRQGQSEKRIAAVLTSARTAPTRACRQHQCIAYFCWKGTQAPVSAMSTRNVHS
jgi:hypothetical protein